MKVTGFNHITLNVSELEKTLQFYTDILGMKLRHRGKRDAYLEWGAAWICIIEKPDYHVIEHDYLGMEHIAFYIEKGHFDEAIKILQENNVSIVRGPVKRGIGWTVNFLDLNGIQFELHTSTLEKRMTVWK